MKVKEGREEWLGARVGGERVWLRKMETAWVAGPAAISDPPIAPTICWMDRTNLMHARPLPPIIIFEEAVVAALAWRSVWTSPWYRVRSLSCEAQFHLSYFGGCLYPISKCILSQRLPTFHSTWGGEVVFPNYPKDCKALDSSLWKKASLATSPTSRDKTC